MVHWTLMVWGVTFGTARRALFSPILVAPKCNSPPINGQCIATSCYSMWHYNCLCTLKGRTAAAVRTLSARWWACWHVDAVQRVIDSADERLRLMADLKAESDEAAAHTAVWKFCYSAFYATPGTLQIQVRDLRLHTYTTLFAIKGSNNKKQTKQRKRSKINHCKISRTQQDNTIQY